MESGENSKTATSQLVLAAQAVISAWEEDEIGQIDGLLINNLEQAVTRLERSQ